MDILKRIDQAQQFCKFYADGAYSVETEKWNHHVNPEFIEDIRQYIESLQLKLMHLQTQQEQEPTAFLASDEHGNIGLSLKENIALQSCGPRATVEPLYGGSAQKNYLKAEQARWIFNLARKLEDTGRLASLSTDQEHTNFILRNRNIQCALEDYLTDLTGIKSWK